LRLAALRLSVFRFFEPSAVTDPPRRISDGRSSRLVNFVTLSFA